MVIRWAGPLLQTRRGGAGDSTVTHPFGTDTTGLESIGEDSTPFGAGRSGSKKGKGVGEETVSAAKKAARAGGILEVIFEEV